MPSALDPQQALDDLLIRWHEWRQGYSPARGFNVRSLVVGDYQSSRQHDDRNGALDEDIETAIMRQVDFEIGELAPAQYVAICVLARALTLGVDVIAQPRMPADKAGAERLVADARDTLMRRLRSAGVVTPTAG